MKNKLQYEDSPYLRQHKNNPIDWYPWCDEAFEKAKNENKPIFISIGYSSCHWCHVMEHEVFENETVAEFVNEHFICIKVDREERPDIDKHYQEVYQLLNRRAGGWPTSIFATPQNKPFYAGTYIPLNNREQMLGFSEITKIIAEKIAKKDEQLFKNADEIVNYLKPSDHPQKATKLHEDFYKNFLLQVKNNYESVYGGFSHSPKFPQTATLTTLLNIFSLYGEQEAKDIVEKTLSTMCLGGMYDLVQGGFCRYSTDEKWLIPHFEKMTYDNALLCELYTKMYFTCKDENYLTIAKESADFMLQYMQEDNLFYSASDADDEGGEGFYFTYTYDEVYDALLEANFDENEIPSILQALHISHKGNFEERNIIRYEESKKNDWYPKVISVLASIRETRTYPFIDKKVQTSWNAMMIKALFALGKTDERYCEIAKKHLDRLLETMFLDGELYHATLIHKVPKIKAFLEDYAFLGSALISAYEATSEELYLIYAQRFANKALEEFYDNGRWFFSKGEFTTQAEIGDNTYPSSVSVMIDLLLSLGSFVEDKYRVFAFKTLEYNSYELGRRPLYYPYMLSQMIRYLKGDRIIKTSSKNLKNNASTIASINYPYILQYTTQSEEFLVCGQESCFANTHNATELDSIINKSIF
jgi:hypothetical protein